MICFQIFPRNTSLSPLYKLMWRSFCSDYLASRKCSDGTDCTGLHLREVMSPRLASTIRALRKRNKPAFSRLLQTVKVLRKQLDHRRIYLTESKVANREIDIHPIEFIVPGKTTVDDQPYFVSLWADVEREIIVCERRLCPPQKNKTAKGEPPTSRGLQMSELEAPNLQRSTERWSRGFGRRGQWSIGAPGGAGTDDACRFGVVSEFGRRIDADHLLGTCVAHRVALSPNRPCFFACRLQEF